MNEQWQIAWKDYYRILQIDDGAEPEVIEGAYRKLAQKYHPDRPGNTDSERIKLINEAHEILGDPDRRRAYDRVRRIRRSRTASATQSESTLLRQTQQELLEKTQEARKLAREAEEKMIEVHREAETAWQAFQDSKKRMEEARNAAMLARKTLESLEGEAAEARKEVTEARKSVRQAEKAERDAWKKAKEIWKKATEAQERVRDVSKTLEDARRQALESEQMRVVAAKWAEDTWRKATQIEANSTDPKVLKEIKQAEKREGEARNRADKAKTKLSFFELKQSSTVDIAKKWAMRLEEAERLKTDSLHAAEAARRLIEEAEKRETEARKAVEEARRRVVQAETREEETRQTTEEFRRRAAETEKEEKDAQQSLDIARRRAEEALKKADQAREKAAEAKKRAEEAQNRMEESKQYEPSRRTVASVFDPAAAEMDEHDIRAQSLHALSMRFQRTVTFGLGLSTVGTETGGFWTGRTGAGQSRIDRGAYEIETRSEHWQAAWSGLRRLRPDFVATLKARKMNGADDQGFGLVFRPSDPRGEASSEAWHFFSFWPRGEVGYHRLEGCKDRAISGLIGRACRSLGPGDAVNEIRVVWCRERGHVFVNGTYEMSLLGLPEEDLQVGGLVVGGGQVRFTGLDLLCAVPPRRRHFLVQTVQWGRIETPPIESVTP